MEKVLTKFAADYNENAIKEYIDGQGGELDVGDRIINIINAVIGVLGLVAVIVVIIGGVQYMTSSGDAQ